MSNQPDHDEPAPSPPPAPPLPPQSRYGQKAATVIARFTQPFFAGPRVSTQRDGKPIKAARSQQEIDVARDSDSKAEAIHRSGLPISALDISPYRTHAVLAGREILKTIRIQDSTCTEDFNLRSKIINYASTHDSNRDAIVAGQRDQLAAVDVKWSHGTYDTTIATAAANGRIVIYDINRPSVEIARLHEHTRQVHRIAFNPHQPAWLLSGSQDGTIRLWDLRALGSGELGGRSVRTCNSCGKYSANSEGVRDVKWSPSDGYTFAVGTENGSVQKWVINKDTSPTLRLHGHDKSCSAVDWHPSGRYLASGSTEKLVKVWDFGGEDRRMKPLNQIRTPQSVVQMQWRPNISNTTGSDNNVLTTQIATSYDAKDPRIHVWDLQRPNVPVLELEKYDTPATSIVWHSRDFLWSVGNTGTFTQNDMRRAYKPASRHGSTLAIGSDGRMAFFSSSKSRYSFVTESLKSHLDPSSPYTEQTPEGSLGVKGISPEEQATENTIHRRRHKAAELRSNNSFSSNPTDEKVDKLEEFKSELIQSFISDQLAAVGHVPQVFDADGFVHLANTYKFPHHSFLTGHISNSIQVIQEAFEQNALCAQTIGDIRLAQTWRILAQAIGTELHRRSKINRQRRLNSKHSHHNSIISKQQFKPPEVKVTSAKIALDVPKANASALATPLARPSQDTSLLHRSLKEEFSLSAASGSSDSSSADSHKVEETHVSAAASRPGHRPVGDESSPNESSSTSSRALQAPDLTGPFSSFPGLEAHLEESRNALNSYRPGPRTVLNLDGPYGIVQDLSTMAPLDRHDSNESFQMFSASADSDNRSFPLEDSFDERKSFSQISNGSFSLSAAPGFPRTKLDDLREDDGATTPLILEPQEPVEDEELPVIEKVNTRMTNDLVSQEPIRRPSFSTHVNIHKSEPVSRAIDQKNDPEFEPSDFLSSEKRPNDVPPWSVYSLLRPLITFHTDALCDVQLPAILSIWLWQFFPTEFKRGQITTLILFYHRRLNNLELFEAAAQLRKCSALLFPEVLEYTAGSSPAIFYCRSCNSALEPSPKPTDSDICARCRNRTADCSICETHIPPATLVSKSQSSTDLWTWCQGCGHGGHASCLSEWFSQSDISEGACPVLGCNHDCVAGSRREEVTAEIERLKKKNRKSVVKDDWNVGESKAVEKARDIVSTDAIPRRGGGSTVLKGGVATGAARANNVAAAGGGRRVRLKIDDENGAALARTERS